MKLNELYVDFYKNYMVKRLKATTIRGYVTNFEKHILPYIGSFNLYDITYSHIDEIVENGFLYGLNNTSVIYVLRSLSKCLNYGVKRGYLKYNVMCTYDYPKKSNFRYSVLSMEQLNHLIDTSFLFTNCFIAFLLSAHYGLRRGEICGLKVDDFNYESKLIYINSSVNIVSKCKVIDTPKNGKCRVILLDDYDAWLIYKYNCENTPNKDGFLLRYNDGKAISPNIIDKTLKIALKKANLPIVRFHDLRHSYATHMIKVGANPKVVSQVLGHSSVKFTLDTYVHFNLSEQKDLLKLL